MLNFRAFDKDLRLMYTKKSMLLHQALEGEIDSKYDMTEDADLIFTLGTGLFDISGRELFEGDIIVSPSSPKKWMVYEITYMPSKAIFCAVPFQRGYRYSDLPTELNVVKLIYTLKDVEVIGNVFENKELLKEDIR